MMKCWVVSVSMESLVSVSSIRVFPYFPTDPIDVLGHLGVDAGLPCSAASVAPAANLKHDS